MPSLRKTRLCRCTAEPNRAVALPRSSMPFLCRSLPVGAMPLLRHSQHRHCYTLHGPSLPWRLRCISLLCLRGAWVSYACASLCFTPPQRCYPMPTPNCAVQCRCLASLCNASATRSQSMQCHGHTLQGCAGALLHVTLPSRRASRLGVASAMRFIALPCRCLSWFVGFALPASLGGVRRRTCPCRPSASRSRAQGR